MQTVPQKVKHILLVGNPNVGKTTLYNALTGSNHHIHRSTFLRLQGVLVGTTLYGAYSILFLFHKNEFNQPTDSNIGAICIFRLSK